MQETREREQLGFSIWRRKDYFLLWMCHSWEPALLSFSVERPVFRLSSVLIGRLSPQMRGHGYGETQGTLKNVF